MIAARAMAWGVLGVFWTGIANAQERVAADDAVLGAGRVRLSLGAGVAWLTYAGPSTQTQAIGGTGVNVEEAAGIGHDLEVGVRFGFRMDDAGRGLRADEVARGADTETFGTGLSAATNPELRLRWRPIRWNAVELSLEDRVTLPIALDPNVTNLVGVRASWHLGKVARLEAGLEGVLTWQSFAAKHVLQPALGVPVQVWVDVAGGLFAGLVGATHAFAGTPYTTSYATETVGLAVGYRFRGCDVVPIATLSDVVQSGLHRGGAGIAFSCRM